MPYPGRGFSKIYIAGTDEAVDLLWRAENGAALGGAGECARDCAREHELRRPR